MRVPFPRVLHRVRDTVDWRVWYLIFFLAYILPSESITVHLIIADQSLFNMSCQAYSYQWCFSKEEMPQMLDANTMLDLINILECHSIHMSR